MGLLELIQRVNEMTPRDFKEKKPKREKREKLRARPQKKNEHKQANSLYREIKENENYWMKNL